MTNVNNKPNKNLCFPITIPCWSGLTFVLNTQVICLKYAKEGNYLELKKDDWRSLWKAAKNLYYFYQTEVKPYWEKNDPELADHYQELLETLNECIHDLKVLYRYASRKKLWVEQQQLWKRQRELSPVFRS